MNKHSQAALVKADFIWHPDTQSFTAHGHVTSTEGVFLIPLAGPLSAVSLRLTGTRFTEPRVTWLGTSSPETAPGGLFFSPVVDSLSLLYVINTNVELEPQPFELILHTEAGTLHLKILNMSLASWQLAAVEPRQIGLAFTGSATLQPIGFNRELRLSSVFTAVRLELLHTIWAPNFPKSGMASSGLYRLDGHSGMNLLVLNPDGEIADPTQLTLETVHGDPFTLSVINLPVPPLRDASMTVAQAVLTFDAATSSFQWSHDSIEIGTPFAVIVVTTVNTTLDSATPILWLPGSTPQAPSNFYVQAVSATQVNLYNLDVALGFFSFNVKTANGTSDPTIVNKVPIQTNPGQEA